MPVERSRDRSRATVVCILRGSGQRENYLDKMEYDLHRFRLPSATMSCYNLLASTALMLKFVYNNSEH